MTFLLAGEITQVEESIPGSVVPLAMFLCSFSVLQNSILLQFNAVVVRLKDFNLKYVFRFFQWAAFNLAPFIRMTKW